MTPPTSSSDRTAGEGSPQRLDESSVVAIRKQLERILASEVFLTSDRLRRFLRFTVEHVLAHNTEPLKEYLIGVQVFDKEESFDPRLDAIVRVEAGRLRSKLREYYDAPGRSDRLRIKLPKRGYTPVFEYTDSQPSDTAKAADRRYQDASPSGRRPYWYIAMTAVAGLALLSGLYFWSTGPLRLSLTGPTTEAGRPARITVAVLPLKNLSGNPDEEYFSDAMTDALITQLAQLKPLHVISMTSVMRYKGAARTVSEIARELNATHVLEGSVLHTTDKVRITAQLIEARTDQHLWAESYERSVVDVLGLQDEVSQRIAQALAGEMLQTSQTPATLSSIDPAVFEAYARGRYFRNQLTSDGFQKGIGYFRQVIDRQPGYAPAYAGIASCYCLLGGHGLELVAPREGIPQAKAAALKALELDDTLAEPHGILGIIRTKYDWDWEGAERAFKRALTLQPSFAQGHAWYSLYLEAMGRYEEAVAQAEMARQLDPLSLGTNVNLAWQLLQAGRDDQAIVELEKTLELNPAFWGTHWALGHYYLKKKKSEDAIAALHKAVDLGGGHTLSRSTLGYGYAVSGRRSEAIEIARELEVMSQDTYVSPAHIAAIYAALEDKDQAFAWLEKAFLARSRSLAWLDVAREWDGLRADPRFAVLRKKVGLAR